MKKDIRGMRQDLQDLINLYESRLKVEPKLIKFYGKTKTKGMMQELKYVISDLKDVLSGKFREINNIFKNT